MRDTFQARRNNLKEKLKLNFPSSFNKRKHSNDTSPTEKTDSKSNIYSSRQLVGNTARVKKLLQHTSNSEISYRQSELAEDGDFID